LEAAVESRRLLFQMPVAGVKLNFIDTGRPMQNAYIESFIGKFRDDCLDELTLQLI
jgi:transposase InsO family protein